MRNRLTKAMMTGRTPTVADLTFSDGSSNDQCQTELHESEVVSDNELRDLVIGACFFASEAKDRPCPETAVDLAAQRERALLLEKLEALPMQQLLHPLVQAEASQRVALICEQRELAKVILRSAFAYGSRKARCYQLALN